MAARRRNLDIDLVRRCEGLDILHGNHGIVAGSDDGCGHLQPRNHLRRDGVVVEVILCVFPGAVGAHQLLGHWHNAAQPLCGRIVIRIGEEALLGAQRLHPAGAEIEAVGRDAVDSVGRRPRLHGRANGDNALQVRNRFPVVRVAQAQHKIAPHRAANQRKGPIACEQRHCARCDGHLVEQRGKKHAPVQCALVKMAIWPMVAQVESEDAVACHEKRVGDV